jgi:CPA2 family monovalent cation:H+ antiporter-2
LVPAVLARIAATRSRELFVLVALTVAVGTALASGAVFGVSLALGAFLAGVVVGESPFSHQVGADLLPFREAFAVLFFVSIGMLVNPSYLLEHWSQVLALSILIVLGKAVLTMAGGFLFRYPPRTTLVIAAGRSQIGEFSFIVGQSGLTLGLIDDAQYSLILAGAIVSITVNPLFFRLIDPIERRLRQWPRLRAVLGRERVEAPPPTQDLDRHVVIVGSGRVGRHIAEALNRLQVPRLVVENDPARLGKLRSLKIPVIFGDAANSEIMEHTALRRARALVITIPDEASASAIAASARRDVPALTIIARAATWDGARRLIAAGANQVVRPELEGGIEIMRRTLVELDLPSLDVQSYADLMRQEDEATL